MNGDAAIELRGLTKDFAVGLRGLRVRAVDHLDLTIPAGGVFGLLGPNGSGKSTAIKLVLGLLAPTAGESRIFGMPGDRPEARSAVGYLPEAPDFPRYLTGRELVRFHARLGGLRAPLLTRRVAEAIERAGLEAAADRRLATYSKGMLQRIGLAQALVHDPRLLIFDEPTAGLDPAGTSAIVTIVRQLKQEGRTVLVTSHLLEQMESLCDRIAILNRGRLVLQGVVSERVDRPPREIVAVDALPAAEQADLRAWLAARGRKTEALEHGHSSLARVFHEQVNGHTAPPAAGKIESGERRELRTHSATAGELPVGRCE